MDDWGIKQSSKGLFNSLLKLVEPYISGLRYWKSVRKVVPTKEGLSRRNGHAPPGPA